MPRYEITIRPDEVIEEFEVTLHGPGLDSQGQRYIFRNPYRAEAFAEAVNFAYQQGLRDGARAAARQNRQVFVVAGRTPDDVHIKPEGWWGRLRRAVLHRLRA